MKAINEQTSLLELAAIVSETLHQAGINAVLSGGAVVSIYSENAYQSYDLDFSSSVAQRYRISRPFDRFRLNYEPRLAELERALMTAKVTFV